MLAEKLSGLEREHKVHVKEVDRRLAELNHAAQKAAEDKLAFFTIAAFQQYQIRMDEFQKDYRIEHQAIVSGVSNAMPRESYEIRHAELIAEMTKALPRQMFDQSQKDLITWREAVAETLAEAKGRATIMAALFGVGSSIAVGLFVGLVLHFWK